MLYYLSLGSNLGEREHALNAAKRLIEQQIGRITRCSSFFYSEPWGFESEHAFCNLCCAVETSLSPLAMLSATQAIERALGRTKKSTDGHYSDRTIDIDIIRAFDENGNEKSYNFQLSTVNLVIPHPLWQERDFVRIPLDEIEQKKSHIRKDEWDF